MPSRQANYGHNQLLNNGFNFPWSVIAEKQCDIFLKRQFAFHRTKLNLVSDTISWMKSSVKLHVLCRLHFVRFVAPVVNKDPFHKCNSRLMPVGAK